MKKKKNETDGALKDANPKERLKEYYQARVLLRMIRGFL